jgi:hypothetical protein
MWFNIFTIGICLFDIFILSVINLQNVMFQSFKNILQTNYEIKVHV